MWKGVIIRESLKDISVLNDVSIVNTRESRLESEGGRGTFHFHSIEVSENKIVRVLESLKKSLKLYWYTHLVKGNDIQVIFSGMIIRAKRGNAKEFEAIKTYALSKGIHADQLPLEHLLDHPFD
ncbi:hypothetical protein HY410_01250 [Candidatus Gottesmanbacteria bacterium]|nr:hypothetical protein [Candidatus Gottesmanbacteria bacterium]